MRRSQSRFCGHKIRLPVLGKLDGANSNLLFLPDLYSLNLLKGQLIPRSIINPGRRRTRMSGDPLRDLDGAPRIHVFRDARRPEAVTTNSFQNAAGLRPFLNQLQNTRRSRRLDSIVSRFLPKEGKSGALGSKPGESVQAKDRLLLSPSSAPEPRVLSLVFLGSVTSACRHARSNR